MHSALAPTYLERPEIACPILLSSQLFSSGRDRFIENAANSNSAAEPDEAKPRVLVVDDAPDVTEMLALFLRHAGYQTVMAYSAQDALDAARDEHFDIIVSDIGMPGMNGYDLAEALRRLPDYDDVPLIAVTGFSVFDDRGRALKAGFNAHLTKPINPMSLLELIQKFKKG
jgi:two-component system, chemotaxis family, CheB/CheR fusion protein